jgi:beta-glucanase (GH16 family)
MLDDVVYNSLDITPAELSEFQNNFFLIMNVAVGGNWPGSPDATTIFPQTMYVDYVRIFQ